MSDLETRVPTGDAQDNDYLLNQIIDLGARVTQLEKLLEGKLEHAVTREEVFGAFADKVLERNLEKRRAPA